MKKKAKVVEDDDPLDREFDFSRSRPNPYWLGVVDRSCVRLIEKELTERFPDSASVNAALRAVLNEELKPQKISARGAVAPKSKKRKVF